MGINNPYFSDLVEVVTNHLTLDVAKRKVLCLGYPDLTITTIEKRILIKDWIWPTQGKYI
jgi:hypothetical protein